jgi:hypothetical protein
MCRFEDFLWFRKRMGVGGKEEQEKGNMMGTCRGGRDEEEERDIGELTSKRQEG